MIRIRLLDLGCVAEAIGLERRLARTLGVLGVVVNPATDTAYIRYDGFRTSTDRLRTAIAPPSRSGARRCSWLFAISRATEPDSG